MSVTPTRRLPSADDNSELFYAHMEADRATAEENYFRPRHDRDTEANRKFFRDGFERAYRQLWKPVEAHLTQIEIDAGEPELACGMCNQGWERFQHENGQMCHRLPNGMVGPCQIPVTVEPGEPQ